MFAQELEGSPLKWDLLYASDTSSRVNKQTDAKMVKQQTNNLALDAGHLDQGRPSPLNQGEAKEKPREYQRNQQKGPIGKTKGKPRTQQGEAMGIPPGGLWFQRFYSA